MRNQYVPLNVLQPITNGILDGGKKQSKVSYAGPASKSVAAKKEEEEEDDDNQPPKPKRILYPPEKYVWPGL